MALYHFHAGVVSRSAGSSAIASAAYRAGEKLHGEYYGEDADYTRKGGVVYTEIFLPSNAPEEYKDRETLWNAVEKNERNPKAQLAYTYDFALQNELTIDENIALARRFVEEQFVSKGMIVDFAVHAPDKKDGGIPNPHVHLLCPIRPLKEDGEWDEKQHRVYRLNENGERIRDKTGRFVFDAVPTTDWGKKDTLLHWREEWANYINRAFEEKGLPCRVDHRSLAEQGIDRPPTIHEGPNIRAMEEKGIQTDKGDFNRWIRETGNAFQKLRRKIKDLLASLKRIREELSAPKESTLMDYINAYYDGRNAGAWSEKAKINNLKARVSAFNFISERKLYTLDDMFSYASAIDDKLSKANTSRKEKEARVRELEKLVSAAEDYEEYLPIINKLRTIKFTKRREAFKAEHDREITLYYAAMRKLKGKANKVGTFPLAAWKKERDKLETEIASENSEYSALYHESMELIKIQRCIEDVRHRQEKTQTQKRRVEQEHSTR